MNKNKMRGMLKISIAFLIGLSLLTSCSEETNNPFPEDRLTADQYGQQIVDLLASSEFGWKFVLTPDSKSIGGYNTVVKFNPNGTCEMAADYYQHNYQYGTTPFDASKVQSNILYRVKHLSNFELSFETYCVVHKLYELGLNSTFQYRIESYTNNEIVLADGKSRMVMTRAAKNDWDMSSYMVSELKFKQYVDNTILFNYLHKGNATKIQLGISFGQRSIQFHFYKSDGHLQMEEIGFYYTPTGMALKRPLVVPGMEPITEMTFGEITAGEGISKILNVTLNGNRESSFYSTVRTMVPVDDGIEHFLKVNGISIAKGGRFWSSRKGFEGGFRYGNSTTYFGLEKEPYFSDFSMYLGYYNPKLNATYNFFSFLFSSGAYTAFYDVYFTYETSGSDQIVFKLDTTKGNGGYSSFVPDEIKVKIAGMVNKMIQPEGYTLVSTPNVNPVDGSLSMFIVDNKDPGFISFRTGTLH